MKKAAIMAGPASEDLVYPQEIKDQIRELCEIVIEHFPVAEITQRQAEFSEIELLFSAWGGPQLNREILACLPRLEAVFYGAGSLRATVTDEFWERGIRITSGAEANATPVAEFTFAHIILGLKQAQRLPALMRKEKKRVMPDYLTDCGAYHNTVALISLGAIARQVAEKLKTLDVRVLAYDPYCSVDGARALGVERVDLETCFEQARVVSLHSPWLPETQGMITGDLLRSMPQGGVFINTARGAVVREDELIEVMRQREDLLAILDVTYPEPAPPESPLYELDNVLLTPHIAGSIDKERARLGMTMFEECRRYLEKNELLYEVTAEAFPRRA